MAECCGVKCIIDQTLIHNCSIVYLFGSAATGKMTSASDLEIAVMCSDDVNGLERITMETALPNLLGRYLDTRYLSKKLAV
jgi:predicted nucleotidyltransferase